jgi:hypothetical protein
LRIVTDRTVGQANVGHRASGKDHIEMPQRPRRGLAVRRCAHLPRRPAALRTEQITMQATAYWPGRTDRQTAQEPMR